MAGHLCYIRLRYADGAGILQPTAREPIRVSVSGGRLLALGNGCPYNLRGYLTEETDPYFGEALAIVEAADGEKLIFRAEGGGCAAELALPIQKEETL